MTDPVMLRDHFRALHGVGTFVMPNPWDLGSAKILAELGFPALATTSAGHAASLGRLDQAVRRDELLAHVESLATALEVPLNVDAEFGFGRDPATVAETVALLAQAGAAGCSIEDYDPVAAQIVDPELAAERVAAAAAVAKRTGMVLTARAENHLYDAGDLYDTIARLRSFRDAGAEVLYAPGLTDLGDIATLVGAVGAPVNVLLFPDGPTVSELASVDVRRVSTGSFPARVAYRALASLGEELRDHGTIGTARADRHDAVVRNALS
jgi:2-methylisocitrate lyase-like PEP mutase family enzyme